MNHYNQLRYLYALSMFACFFSCKMQPSSNRSYDEYDSAKLYHLRLAPRSGSTYLYDLSNQQQVNFEVDDKKSEQLSRTTATISYHITSDTNRNTLFHTEYKKIHLYTKKDEVESDADAENSAFSSNPTERMLAVIKSAKIVVTVSPNGETVNISGYQQLGDSIINQLDAGDERVRQVLQQQWKKSIENGLVKQNMTQLFKIFPDSAVHLNDTWKLNSKLDGEIGMTVKSIYKLKAINSEIGIIEARGTITGDNTANGLFGSSGATINDLKGDQQAELEMESKTGMILNGTIKGSVTGNMIVMGKEVAIKIKTILKITGARK
jgi:hypothetical protein